MTWLLLSLARWVALCGPSEEQQVGIWFLRHWDSSEPSTYICDVGEGTQVAHLARLQPVGTTAVASASVEKRSAPTELAPGECQMSLLPVSPVPSPPHLSLGQTASGNRVGDRWEQRKGG